VVSASASNAAEPVSPSTNQCRLFPESDRSWFECEFEVWTPDVRGPLVTALGSPLVLACAVRAVSHSMPLTLLTPALSAGVSKAVCPLSAIPRKRPHAVLGRHVEMGQEPTYFNAIRVGFCGCAPFRGRVPSSAPFYRSCQPAKPNPRDGVTSHSRVQGCSASAPPRQRRG